VKKILICMLAAGMTAGFSGVERVSAQDPYAFGEISYLAGETGFGARALSLGGAYLSIAEDYSAIYWNPAGLGLLRSNELFTSLAHNNRNIETSFLNRGTDNTQSKTSFGSIGLVYAAEVYQGSLVFAGGYNRVQNYNSLFGYSGFNSGLTYVGDMFVVTDPDLGIDYPLAPNSLNQEEAVEEDGQLSQYSFGVSFEAAQNVFLGATMNFWSGTNDYSQLYIEKDTRDIYTVYPEDFDNYLQESSVITSIRGYDLKLGLLYLYSDFLRFGATLNTPRYLRLHEEWDINEDMEFDDATVDYLEDFDDYGGFDYKVQTPFTFGAGFSYFFPNGIFAGEFSYTDWSQLKYRDDSPIAGVNKNEANRNIKQTLAGVFSPKFGIEYGVQKVKLRAGFALEPSPIKDAKSESDRKFFTAGVGLPLGPDAQLDIAYRKGWWKTATVSNLSLVEVGESHVDHRVFASVYFRFK